MCEQQGLLYVQASDCLYSLILYHELSRSFTVTLNGAKAISSCCYWW